MDVLGLENRATILVYSAAEIHPFCTLNCSDLPLPAPSLV